MHLFIVTLHSMHFIKKQFFRADKQILIDCVMIDELDTTRVLAIAITNPNQSIELIHASLLAQYSRGHLNQIARRLFFP